MTTPPQPSHSPAIPATGKALELNYGPKGLSVPANAQVSDVIDQVNNITIVFTASTGAELADYYRKTLPSLGFKITADGNNSLLFENEHWHGGFTAAGAYCALTLRTDW